MDRDAVIQNNAGGGMDSRRLAIFDFDKTMIAGDSIMDFVSFLRQKGLISFPRTLAIIGSTLLWMLRLLPVEKAKSQALAPLRRLNEKDAASLCREFVENRLAPRLFPAAKKAMQRHHLNSDIILLVSASPACYLSHIRHYLPVDAVLATTTDSQYRVLTNVRGEEKPRQVKQWLEAQGIRPNWEDSCAYGDSKSDLPVLTLTGNPFWVNPDRAALKAAPRLPRLRWE